VDIIAFCNQNTTILNKDNLPMPALTIKNIPTELYNELKHVAAQHHRSINSEVIIRLKETLFPRRISPKDRLASIQAFRSQIKPNIIATEDIEQVINQGRP
jgi:plasmid stability protein